jgi:hypothetical protein
MFRISVSWGRTKISINGLANKKTRMEMTREKRTVVIKALFTPLRIRSSFLAPKFWAIKVEKAFPNSCTGI